MSNNSLCARACLCQYDGCGSPTLSQGSLLPAGSRRVKHGDGSWLATDDVEQHSVETRPR